MPATTVRETKTFNAIQWSDNAAEIQTLVAPHMLVYVSLNGQRVVLRRREGDFIILDPGYWLVKNGDHVYALSNADFVVQFEQV